MPIDPVCGRTVHEGHGANVTYYKRDQICFCSVVCKATFDADPERYSGKQDVDSTALDGLTVRAVTGVRRVWDAVEMDCTVDAKDEIGDLSAGLHTCKLYFTLSAFQQMLRELIPQPAAKETDDALQT